jgi:hypothetical protein
MATTTKTKVGGSWRNVNDIRFKSGGNWKQVTQGLYKVSGVWKTFFQLGGAPSVVIDNPTGATIIEVGNVVNIQITATDTDSVDEAKFYIKGPSDGEYGYIGNDLSATVIGDDYSFSYNWANSESGQHSIKVEGIDALGLTGVAYLDVMVNEVGNVDPVITIDSPAEAAHVTIGVQTVISTTATDADAGDSVAQVHFYVGGNYVGTDVTGVADVFTFTWTPLATGAAVITAYAYDTRGGVSTVATRNIVVDAAPVAPVATITSPANDTNYNESDPVTVNFNYSDADSDATDYRVLIDNTQVVAWTSVTGGGASGSESQVVNPPGTGDKRIRVEVRDSGSRVGSSEIDVDMNTVVVLPTVTWVSPVSGSGVETGSAITVQVNVIQGDNPITSADMAFASDLSTRFPLSYNGTTGYWEATLNVPNYYDPAIVLRAWGTDDQGNEATKLHAFHSNAKPTITAVSSKSVATGTAAVFTVYSYRNEFYQSGAPFADQHTITVANQPAGTTVNTVDNGDEKVTTITIPNSLSAGTYNLEVRVDDGYWAVATAPVVLTVSDVDLPPTVTLVVDDSSPKQGIQFAFTATANDPEAKLREVAIQMQEDDLSWSLVTSVGGSLANDYARVFPIIRTTVGVRKYRARAKDEGGQYGYSSEITITLGYNFPPVYQGDSLFKFNVGSGGNMEFSVLNANFDDQVFTITATADPGNPGGDLKTAAEAIGVTPTDSGYDCSVAIPSNLLPGTHTVTITMDDGWNAAVVAQKTIEINAAPVVWGGALSSVWDTLVENVVSVTTVFATDDNGESDIVTFAPTAALPSGFTYSNPSPGKCQITFDGTAAAGSLSFVLLATDSEGLNSNEHEMFVTISAPAAYPLTFVGPTGLTWYSLGNANNVAVITATDGNGSNITGYSAAGGAAIDTTFEYQYYDGANWAVGSPPTPVSAKRRVVIRGTIASGDQDASPYTVRVTATDINGGTHDHDLDIIAVYNG